MSKKLIVVKFFPPEEAGCRIKPAIFRAPQGKVWTDSSLEEAEEKVIEWLDVKFPYWNFKSVRVGPLAINFVFDGLRRENES
jgi:hypothetical protein